jgi:hypothetical protein
MTFLYPTPKQRAANDPLFNSPADWVSPGLEDGEAPGESRWLTDPPPAEGRKVVISDTDHYSPFGADALWAWKSFLRGHHPILYDFGMVDLVRPPAPWSGLPSSASYEPARRAMGDTLRFARRVDLLAMAPRGDLSSTGYALACPGAEYLVLNPSDAADPFTVTLTAGTYGVEWHDVTSRRTAMAAPVMVSGDGAISFTAPFVPAGPAVVYLRRPGH